jgi:hypothetical protein
VDHSLNLDASRLGPLADRWPRSERAKHNFFVASGTSTIPLDLGDRSLSPIKTVKIFTIIKSSAQIHSPDLVGALKPHSFILHSF